MTTLYPANGIKQEAPAMELQNSAALDAAAVEVNEFLAGAIEALSPREAPAPRVREDKLNNTPSFSMNPVPRM